MFSSVLPELFRPEPSRATSPVSSIYFNSLRSIHILDDNEQLKYHTYILSEDI